LSPANNPTTASVSGISTPTCRALCSSAGAVATPSVTFVRCPNTSSSASPLPNANPSEKFRLFAPVQVNNKSPSPDNPNTVSARPPSAAASRAISATPRVISAARAFSPSPAPITAPAAIAITFFAAPPTDAPTTSALP
jgi:hypothetical protein